MEVADEHLRQEIRRDHHGRKIRHGPCTEVEQELVAVAQLDEEATRGLATACRRKPRAASGHANLICAEWLSARVVDIALGCDTVRVRYLAAGCVGSWDQLKLPIGLPHESARGKNRCCRRQCDTSAYCVRRLHALPPELSAFGGRHNQLDRGRTRSCRIIDSTEFNLQNLRDDAAQQFAAVRRFAFVFYPSPARCFGSGICETKYSGNLLH